MKSRHNDQQTGYQQLVLPGTPIAPEPLVVVMLDRITHTVDRPECTVKSCCCHEYERLRLLEEAGLIVEGSAHVVK